MRDFGTLAGYLGSGKNIAFQPPPTFILFAITVNQIQHSTTSLEMAFYSVGAKVSIAAAYTVVAGSKHAADFYIAHVLTVIYIIRDNLAYIFTNRKFRTIGDPLKSLDQRYRDILGFLSLRIFGFFIES